MQNENIDLMRESDEPDITSTWDGVIIVTDQQGKNQGN